LSLLCCLVWHYPSSVGWASCPVLISEQAGRLCVHSPFWSRGPCLVAARKSETVLRIHHLDSATTRPYALHFPPLYCIHMDTLWRQRVWVRLGGLSALLTTAPKGGPCWGQFSLPLPALYLLPRIPSCGDDVVSAWEKTLDCVLLHWPLPVGVVAELEDSWAGHVIHKVVVLVSSLW